MRKAILSIVWTMLALLALATKSQGERLYLKKWFSCREQGAEETGRILFPDTIDDLESLSDALTAFGHRTKPSDLEDQDFLRPRVLLAGHAASENLLELTTALQHLTDIISLYADCTNWVNGGAANTSHLFSTLLKDEIFLTSKTIWSISELLPRCEALLCSSSSPEIQSFASQIDTGLRATMSSMSRSRTSLHSLKEALIDMRAYYHSPTMYPADLLARSLLLWLPGSKHGLAVDASIEDVMGVTDNVLSQVRILQMFLLSTFPRSGEQSEVLRPLAKSVVKPDRVAQILRLMLMRIHIATV